VGREIVYCSRCAIRLTVADVDSGSAHRGGRPVLCSACAPIARDDGSPSGEELPPPPETALEILPEACSAERGRRKAVLASAGVAGAILILGIIAYPTLTPEAPMDAVADPSIVTVLGPKRTGSQRESAGGAPDRDAEAMLALDEARRHGGERPEDLQARIQRLTGVALSWEGTTAAREAHEESQRLRGRLLAGIDRELEGVDRDVEATASREEFGKAFDLLALTKALHAYPAWTFEVDRRIQRVESRARGLLGPLLEEAREARRKGLEGDVREIRRRVAGWGCPTLLAELDRALSAAEVRPIAPSPEARAYQEQWERAWIDASWGDFSGAERRLREAAAILREPALAKESGQDLQDLVLMGALRRLVAGLLSSARPGDRPGLVAARVSARPGLIADPVYRAHPDGLEFNMPSCQVEWPQPL
jgi:hypothetical protein